MNSKRTVCLVVAAVASLVSPLIGMAEDQTSPATEPAAAAQPAIQPPTQPPAQPPSQTGVTLINIHMTQALPEEVFGQLAKQSGIKFSNNNNLWDQDAMQIPMDVDLKDKPFWSAVRELCGLWNLTPQPGFNNSPKRIELQYFNGGQQGWSKMPAVEAQGVLVMAESFNRQQSISYGGNTVGRFGGQNFCSVQVMVCVDPALHVQSMNQSLRATEAVDDAGNSMLMDRGNNMFFGGGQGQRSLIYNCQIPLKFPDNAGKKIAHLKFNVQMRTADGMDTLSVEKPLEAADTAKTFGDMTLTFHGLKKSGQMYELKLGVSGGDDPNAQNNMWNTLQSASLVDAKGRAFNYNGGGGGGGGMNGEAEYTMNYSSMGGDPNDAPGDPAKWSIEMPTQTHVLKVPVEFNDLPLP